MIKSLFVENFMRIGARLDLDLGAVTVLVGKNGSGKSSLLKAVHWAVRCATLRDWKDNTSLDRMDYTPSRDFLDLAHKSRLRSQDQAPKAIVGFIDGNGDQTTISLSTARNEAGAKAQIDGPLKASLTQEIPQTAYIPGIAGLAETETLLATPILHRRAASGEGGSVLRHILLELAGESLNTGVETVELVDLGGWVSKVLPETRFWVKFDRLRDSSISAFFLTSEMKITGKPIELQRRPLEMAGTGYLQVVQIFAYLLKFRPQLLLIDEPDAHLHSGTQERLIQTLEEAASKFPDTKIIITTHSPALVRACSQTTFVRWIDDGKLSAENETQVRLKMGWSVLDKELIIFSEDEDLSYMQSIISQWPSISRRVLLWPTFGVGGLSSGIAYNKLRKCLGTKILIHRDRDFMSDGDILAWKKKKGFDTYNIPLWVPSGADIESAFCDKYHVQKTFDLSDEQISDVMDQTLASFEVGTVERDFNTALSGAINELGREERSIPTVRWREIGEFSLSAIKGKLLLSAIKKSVKNVLKDSPEAPKLGKIPQLTKGSATYPLCEDLRLEIERVLSDPLP